MKRINGDIKQNIYAPAYLLMGDEAYLKTEFKKKLIKALVNEGDTLNFSAFNRERYNENEIVDLAQTLPFLAEKRVILIEETGCLKKENKKLAAYLAEPNPDTVLIFVESDVDKRNAVYKALTKLERVVEMTQPSEEDMARWVGSKLSGVGKQMDRAAYNEFYARSALSMDNIVSELEKLISYTGNRTTITLEDVKTMTVERPEAKIFELLDAMVAKNTKRVMDLYSDMLLTKEEPMSILYRITSQFRTLIAVKELSDRGENPASITSYLGARDFVVRKLLRQKDSFSYKEINSLLDEAAAAEAAFKSGRLDDSLAVELILTKYSA